MQSLINTLRLFFAWILLELRALIAARKKPDNRRVGLISFRLPPQFDSGTHRPLSFIRYANLSDWQVNPITNSPDKDIVNAGKELQKLLPDNTNIVEVKDVYSPTSWRFTPALDGSLAMAVSVAIAAVKQFRNDPPAALIASGPPFCYCIAGLLASRVLGIPLILDYRDEWTLCPFAFASKHPMDKWFEKRCVAHADMILYTTESHMLSHREHFGIAPEKQDVVFNGWEDQGFETPTASEKQRQDGKIKISFIGRLNEMVSVTSFLDALDKAVSGEPELTDRVVVEFVGEKSNKLQGELDPFLNKALSYTLNSIPPVSKSEALTMMKESDYLLMLCGKTIAGYIQGKLYDYLSRRVPVIGYGFPGEVPSILQSNKAGFFIQDQDIDGLRNVLKGEVPNLFENDTLQAWLPTRTRAHQASRLFDIVTKVVS